MTPKRFSKLYERGSLCNTATGFELAFKNTIAPSTILEFGSLTVDGQAVARDQILVRLERPSERIGREGTVREWPAKIIGGERMVPFDLFTVARVQVTASPLPPGSHQVMLAIRTREVGEMTLTAEDSIAPT